MEKFKVIAFTHKHLDLSDVGNLHIADDRYAECMMSLKKYFNLKELMYLSTCNRVEFFMVKNNDNDIISPSELLLVAVPHLSSSLLTHLSHNAVQYEGDGAVKHIFKVASSIDSLVVGEREIITQVRESYEKAHLSNFAGDFLRLVIKQTINCAKQVYTETNIARNPVSVVSLAFNKLKENNISKDAKVLVIGSGVTNTNMARFVKKMGLKNFSIFNRTKSNAEKLAMEIKGDIYSLTELNTYNKGFDVILTCTGAANSIITPSLYKHLLQGDNSAKIVVDLAVPNDFDTSILQLHNVNYIEVKSLQEIAQQNIAKREKELVKCKSIIGDNIKEFNTLYKTRLVEIAMQAVPQKVKEIRDNAINAVFAKDLELLDKESKETLNKVIDYLEKKYISIPMIMAKDILLEEIENN